jgi:hypothetical protein
MTIKKPLLLLITIVTLFTLYKSYEKSKEYGAPPYVEESTDNRIETDMDTYLNWKRPEGPIRIGLQAGHWKTNEMPEEQQKIMEAGGGTTGQGVPEWQIALNIAEETKKILEEKGYVVDILPATVPEKYLADAFVSIHADGNLSPLIKGYKVAAYRRDRTGNANKLSDFIDTEYPKATNFVKDPSISRNMTGYYAFNSRRYTHAIHPMTPGVIVETGFATNYSDVSVLINHPEIPARGIANGIISFIESLDIKL